MEQTLILLRNLQLVVEPANDIRESLVNDNDWSCGFDLKSEYGNVIVTTGGHGVAAGPDADIFKPPMDNIYPFSG